MYVVLDQEDGIVSTAMDRETSTVGAETTTDHRVIFINRTQPPVHKFVNNHISTAKYRFYIYLENAPKNLIIIAF